MPKSSRDLTWRERNEKLASNIAADGFIMPTRCYHCTKANKECKVDLRSGRCSECALNAQSCNLQITRIEYERIRKEQLNVAKELDEAEEEEDAITEKLLAHRRKIRCLRKQLRMKESKEQKAQDKEEASIAEAAQLEQELASDPSEPIPLDLPSFDVMPMEGRLLLSPHA